jgi:hypothetical protein
MTLCGLLRLDPIYKDKKMELNLARHFPRFKELETIVPVYHITHHSPITMHRFFNTCPISPSGRWIGLTQFPDNEKIPEPYDIAKVLLIDLQSGKIKEIEETAAWDSQLGAQVQWGANDSQLFYNNMNTETWRPYAVIRDVKSGKRRELEGTVYMASSDGKKLVSPCLRRIRKTQEGYGVRIPDSVLPLNYGAPEDDGIYITDVISGKSKLVLSINKIVDTLQLPITEENKIGYYVFHTFWNKSNDRISIKFRRFDNSGFGHDFCIDMWVITFKEDGSDINIAVSAELKKFGGHHHTWWSDRTLTMNLLPDRKNIRFSKFDYNGSNLEPLTNKVLGSGHPSLHPDGKYLVADSYLWEPIAGEDGTVPLRFVNIKTGKEKTILRIPTRVCYANSSKPLPAVMRIDPHPVWDRTGRYITFNASTDQGRGVFIADLASLLQ